MNLEIDTKVVVAAAMVACGNIDEGHLISWCFTNGTDESLVYEKYSEAQNDPRYTPLLSPSQDERPTSNLQR